MAKKNYISLNHRPIFFGFFLISFFAYLPWLLGQWPGIFNLDSFDMIQDARHKIINMWFSYAYSAFLVVMQSITHNPGLVIIFQVIFAAIITAIIFSWIYERSEKSKITFIFFTMFILLPRNGALNVSIMRNSLFSWFFLLSLFYFFAIAYDICLQKKDISIWRFIALSLSILMAGILRQDTLIIVFLLPVFLVFLCRKNIKSIRKFLYFHAGVLIISSPLIFITQENFSYNIVAMLNPLSYIVSRDYQSEDKNRDAKIIDRVVNYEFIVHPRDENDIYALHDGGMRADATDTDNNNFSILFLKIIINNPGLFLENRLKMFSLMMQDFYFPDELAASSERGAEYMAKLNIAKAPISLGMQSFTNGLLTKTLNIGVPFFYLYSSAWIALGLCILSAAAIYWLPISGAISILMLARTAVVFLTTPAVIFNYIISLYFLGWILIPLLILEWRTQKNT